MPSDLHICQCKCGSTIQIKKDGPFVREVLGGHQLSILHHRFRYGSARKLSNKTIVCDNIVPSRYRSDMMVHCHHHTRVTSFKKVEV